MTSSLSHATRCTALVGYLALTAAAHGGTAAEKARRFEAGNFEILGITLGKTDEADLARILGSAPSVQAKEPEESVRCYVSSGADKTVLEVRDWVGTVVEFRLLEGPARTEGNCATTPRVSNLLATGNGLKLGMSRGEVIRLLGKPTKTRKGAYIYESSFERPLTAEEGQRAQRSYHEPPRVVEVYEKIELRFKGPIVVLVDAVRSETW